MNKIIETMPTHLGRQFYPSESPLPATQVLVNGRSVNDIFLGTCDGNFGEDNPDLAIINDYYRYHLLAPCFDLGDISGEEIMSANGDRLFEICMDLGIDPI